MARYLLVALTLACIALSALSFGARAQPAAGKVDAEMRKLVVETAIRELNDRYVFPEVAKKAEAALRAKLAARAFDGLDDAVKFAEALTTEIQAVTQDKHIRVRYSASPRSEPTERGEPSAAERAEMRRSAEIRNFGIDKVERLPGNLGYIELRGFVSAELAGEAIAAAMSLVVHTEALIIDLRRNGGGDPATVAFMTSYLFDERTHLNNMYYRDGNRTAQFWTQDYVPGKRYGQKKPVYVLTAKRTFSGAEEFSYNLKNLKRATLVGETTGGGAHPGGMRLLTPHFGMFVPNGRAINPISKTNWEGTGVEPDIKAPADDALRVAQLMALNKILAAEKGEDYARMLKERIAELEKAAPVR